MRAAARLIPLLFAGLAAGCGPRPNGAGAGEPARVDRAGARLESPAATGLLVPYDLPAEALARLAESTADSCAVCRRELRRKAFAVLDESLRPGTIVRADSDSRLRRAGGGGQELELVPSSPDGLRITFRFHTLTDRLVGIGDDDLTAAPLARRILSVPVGAPVRGTLEIVEFAYGDGPGYLFFPEGTRLQVQCRILGLDPE